METFQERVIAEHSDLEKKVLALHSFIGSEKFTSLDHHEQGRLKRQLNHMRDYLTVLEERIDAFPRVMTKITDVNSFDLMPDGSLAMQGVAETFPQYKEEEELSNVRKTKKEKKGE